MTGQMATSAAAPHYTHYRRFDRVDRLMHGFLMFSFLGLAFSGLPLLFSHEAWAARLARFLGGFETAGTFHRLCAVVMLSVFVTHLGRIFQRLFRLHVCSDFFSQLLSPILKF